MNFLLDAQLPRRLVYRLREAGHDALHTLDLPAGNRTSDTHIIAFAESDNRIVVTKDADFVNSFTLFHQPPKLLLISTGNISNDELKTLLINHLQRIVAGFQNFDFLELSRDALILHR